jgi:spore germination protein YaaH
VFDFEGHAPSDLAALRRVTRRLADAVRAGGGREVALAIPALDTLAFPAAPLAEDVDRLVLMLYDRHWAGSGPGPVAPPAWVDTALTVRLAEVPAERLVAALPLYGYRWPRSAAGETIGLADAQRIADSAKVPLVRDSASWHLTAELPDGGALWVADEAVLARLLAGAQQRGIRRAAFWRLGLEDPGVWALPRRLRRPLPDR